MSEILLSIRHPLRFRVGFSRCLLVALSVIHLGAGLSLCLTPLPWLGCASIGLLIIASFYHHVRRHLLWQQRPFSRELVMQQHQFYLNDEQQADILEAYVQQFVVLIWLRLPHQRKDVLMICSDAVPADEFRRLRVRLKHPERN